MKTIRMILFLIVFSFLSASCALIPSATEQVHGMVISGENGQPQPGALVTLRASTYQTYTDESGEFILTILEGQTELEITAWAPGFYISSETISLPIEFLELTLRKYHSVDNPSYVWVIPTANSSESACGNCHPMILSQWAGNAHSQSVSNPRFMSFYRGSNVSGSQVGLRGFTSDFPGTAGNCSTCHAPGAAIDAPFTTAMDDLQDGESAAIHCDFCHKVSGIFLNSADLLPYDNVPGVLSMKVLRPPEGEQIFLGPYPDIHDPDTYHPVFSESDFCAPCHRFSFWGAEIYNSYGEWLESDYASQGITCQDCHMPPSGDEFFALPEQGGLAHDPDIIPSHFQLGIKDEDFMRDTLQTEITYDLENGFLNLSVTLTNATAGHHVPTDHPGRHLILSVHAETISGVPLIYVEGPVLPSWSGEYAGEAGIIFAKILQDVVSGEYPVVSYWSPTLIYSDNRIQANESRTSNFTYQISEEDVQVQVLVLFRRMYQPIAEEYGWDLSEIKLVEEKLIIQQ